MTIIRNDRSATQRTQNAQAAAAKDSAEEPEIDYTWRPTPEDFEPGISVEQWLELLGDTSVFDKDGLTAVENLNDYGGPATFQQLSVRFGGTMGRYRRWIDGVAQNVCKKVDVEPPVDEETGEPQWWAVLYQQRPAGKRAANRFEMRLRAELSDALTQRATNQQEEQTQAKKAADEAQAKARAAASRKVIAERIARAQEAQAATAVPKETETSVAPASEPTAPAAASSTTTARGTKSRKRKGAAATNAKVNTQETLDTTQGSVTVSMSGRAKKTSTPEVARYQPHVNEEAESIHAFASVSSFLEIMAEEEDAFKRIDGVSKFADSAAGKGGISLHASQEDYASYARLNYAKNYAHRLHDVLDLMKEGTPRLSAATLAREMGDESVEQLQDVLNGDRIAPFAYLDTFCDKTFAYPERLEADDETAHELPAFSTLRELCGAKQAAEYLGHHAPTQLIFVVDDSKDRRTGVILRFSALRYLLLERVPVNASADRTKDPALKAFVLMVRDLDDYARRSNTEKISLTISATEWDSLAAGHIWPGTIVARHS